MHRHAYFHGRSALYVCWLFLEPPLRCLIKRGSGR